MKGVRMRIAAVYLRDALHLPEQAAIVGAGTVHQHGETAVELTIEHPDFPNVRPGDEIPLVCPTFDKDDAGNARLHSWDLPAGPYR